ncbi:hypothetical protein ABRQ22_17245 [Cellulosimicrobium sp. ES-005]|uniref:Uncharacterized protein n=1 Tax=Cellulosimicrobium sp. ES-005 TaxID=3163031 RepID=A0AAU8FYM2_9MICO
MPRYVRVRDDVTGHEKDVPEGYWLIGNGLTPVKADRYPPSTVARRAKPRVKKLAGQSAKRRARRPVEPDTATEKE